MRGVWIWYSKFCHSLNRQKVMRRLILAVNINALNCCRDGNDVNEGLLTFDLTRKVQRCIVCTNQRPRLD